MDTNDFIRKESANEMKGNKKSLIFVYIKVISIINLIKMRKKIARTADTHTHTRTTELCKAQSMQMKAIAKTFLRSDEFTHTHTHLKNGTHARQEDETHLNVLIQKKDE